MVARTRLCAIRDGLAKYRVRFRNGIGNGDHMIKTIFATVLFLCLTVFSFTAKGQDLWVGLISPPLGCSSHEGVIEVLEAMMGGNEAAYKQAQSRNNCKKSLFFIDKIFTVDYCEGPVTKATFKIENTDVGTFWFPTFSVAKYFMLPSLADDCLEKSTQWESAQWELEGAGD